MGKQRRIGWLVVYFYVGAVAVIGPGCATGGDGSYGDGGAGGDDTWGSGSGSSSGMSSSGMSASGMSASGMAGTGSSSSSSGTSSSGKPCSGPEVCNGLDDDCNGQIDDNVAQAPCNTGLMGVCGVGKTTGCIGGSPSCMQTNMPTAEICDNLDNDCNGQVDDNAPGGGAMCLTGMAGPCGFGITKCMAGKFVCTSQTQAMPEVCGDNVDNDCDGVVDDGC